jgi:hypothetical protein
MIKIGNIGCNIAQLSGKRKGFSLLNELIADRFD